MHGIRPGQEFDDYLVERALGAERDAKRHRIAALITTLVLGVPLTLISIWLGSSRDALAIARDERDIALAEVQLQRNRAAGLADTLEKTRLEIQRRKDYYDDLFASYVRADEKLGISEDENAALRRHLAVHHADVQMLRYEVGRWQRRAAAWECTAGGRKDCNPVKIGFGGVR